MAVEQQVIVILEVTAVKAVAVAVEVTTAVEQLLLEVMD